MALADKVSNSPLDIKIITPGTVPRICHDYVEAASQSYTAGALLYAGTDGTVTAVAAGGAAIAANTTLVGVALKDATGVTSAYAPVLVPDLNSEVIIVSGTSGTAVVPTSTLFPIGKSFDIWMDASGYPTLDSGSTSNDKLLVIGYIKKADGTNDTLLRCKPVWASWAVYTSVA